MEKHINRNDYPARIDQSRYENFSQWIKEDKIEMYDIYCYDTEDLKLRSQGYILRVKCFQDGKHEISLLHVLSKHSLDQEIISPVSIERMHRILFADYFEDTDGPLHKRLNELTKDDLVFIGKIFTKRFVIKNENVIYKIGKNLFVDGSIHYELCLGFRTNDPQIIEEEIKNLWDNYGISFSETFISKYDRLIELRNAVSR